MYAAFEHSVFWSLFGNQCPRILHTLRQTQPARTQVDYEMMDDLSSFCGSETRILKFPDC